MTHPHRIAALALALLATFGCSTTAATETAQPAATTATTAAPTTSVTELAAAPTTTTAPTAATPPAAPDWVAIAGDVIRRDWELTTNPTAAVVEAVHWEGSPAVEGRRTTVEWLRTNNAHARGAAPTVLAATPLDNAANLHTLRVELQAPAAVDIVTTDGTVLQHVPIDWSTKAVLLTIAPTGPGGSWRAHQWISTDEASQ